MSDHQWLHGENENVVTSSRIEMLAVLRCAASLARKEGMKHTAARLENDADRIADLCDGGQVTVIVR